MTFLLTESAASSGVMVTPPDVYWRAESRRLLKRNDRGGCASSDTDGARKPSPAEARKNSHGSVVMAAEIFGFVALKRPKFS